ncbi:MAG: HlyD family efflux transporter periplasmic adaptor subunit [Betaproteobacteria bacterium]
MSGLLKQLREIHNAENPGVAPVSVAPAIGATATLHVNAATILRLQATLLSRDAFQDAAAAFAAELAALLRFDRVAIGFLHGRHVTVAAVSGAADIKSRSEFADLARAAMEEAVEQRSAVAFPASQADKPRITFAHAQFVQRMGGAIFSVPLVSRREIFGAASFVRSDGTTPSQAEITQCERAMTLIAPVLQLRHGAALPWQTRATKSLGNAFDRIRRPGHTAAKAAVALAVAAVIALAVVPVPYRVSAPARLEGAVQRALVAPADGFLRQVNVKPGDSVQAGQVLAELAEDDLRLERRKWESELAQYENSASAALARTDRTQFVINQAKADEANAQLDLIGKQLDRGRVVAPFNGIVIQGDLSQSLGAPVERGEVLMTIAPAGEYRVVVEVDERDIEDVQTGKTGYLALGAFEKSLRFTVERVTPMAASRDGRNFFEVEGKLVDAPASMRPGSQGIGKIEAENRTIAWVCTHRLVQWMRTTLWSWGL